MTYFSTAPSVTKSSLAMPGIRASLGHEHEHLALTRRQFGQGVRSPLAAEQLGDEGRIDRRSTACDAPDCRHELVDVRDAVLQQVADATGR